MGFQEAQDLDRLTQQDLNAMLDQAWSNNKPIPLDRAREILGGRFSEAILARETLIIQQNGRRLLLPPSTWIKVLTRLKRMECARPAAAVMPPR